MASLWHKIIMCGITGIYNLNNKPAKEDILRQMTEVLKIRGPDDIGFYLDENLGLGQTRLSIIDLSSAGHQPMANENKTLWIVFNGEIYNFKEIKKDLEEKGYKFKSNSDTEVILKSYEEWGIESIKKFRGMFSFAIWDNQQGKLFLVRDRAGVKPLYYYSSNGTFLFSSEIKSFHKNPHFKKEINFASLALFLQFGYILSPHTIFKDCYKVRPGHYIEVSKQGIKEIKYWDVIDYFLKEPFKSSEDEIAQELEKILIESLNYRMVSDVPVGIFLSGGIDSSLVTALLQKNSPNALNTFTVGFKEKGYDEAPYAKKIANHLKTNHHEIYCTAKDALDVIPKLSEIYDEPFGDSSGIPTYLISKFAREKIKVALSADAGDEIFCGYSRYAAIKKYYEFVNNIPQFLLSFISASIQPFSNDVIESIYKSVPGLPRQTSLAGKIYKFKNVLSYNGKNLQKIMENSSSYWPERKMKNIIAKNYEILPNNFSEFSRLKKMPILSQMQAIDYKTYLCDDIFVKVDRATMAASLEAREPLADHKLTEFMAQVPAEMKYKNGQSKYILRKILYKYVPKEFLERPKQGFEIPVGDWLKGDLKGILKEYLSEGRIKNQGIFNANQLNVDLDKFLSGKYDNPYKYWFLLIFQMWHEKWMN